MKKRFLCLTIAAICATSTIMYETVSAKRTIKLDVNEDLVGASSVASYDIPEHFKYARTVIGEDERSLVENTKEKGYSAIGYILVKYPDGKSTRGTAWMASESVAITSAHCLFSSVHGGQAVEVTFIPGRNGSTCPFSISKSTSFYIPEEYKVNENDNYDYAMIKFDTKIGRKTGYITPQSITEKILSYDFTVSGYPVNLNNDTSKTCYQQYKHIGSIFSYTDTKLYYYMDTSSGDSGAPIFYQDPINKHYYAVGVHRGGNNSRNVGIKFTNDFIDNVFKPYK